MHILGEIDITVSLIIAVHQWRCFVHEVIFLTPIKASSNILQEVVMEETKKTKLEIKVGYIKFL